MLKKIMLLLTCAGIYHLEASTVPVISRISANAVALQSDGKIVTANTAVVSGITQVLVCRYNTDGSLDSTFGSTQNGTIFTAVGSSATATSLGIQADGSILVGGITLNSGTNQGFVIRYLSSGALDTSFGPDGTGIVVQSIGNANIINGLTIASDGSIIAAGAAVVDGVIQFALISLTSTGALNTAFNGSGMVTTSIGDGAIGQAITLQSNGQILVAGYAVINAVEQCVVARYNSDGSLDTNFGTAGVASVSIGSVSQAFAIALDANQNCIIAGTADNQFAAARLLPDGSLDTTFGTNGMQTTAIGSVAQANAVLIQSDGKIVLVGYTDSSQALVRYQTDGTLDTAFGTNGIVITSLENVIAANAAILQTNGEILTVGFVDEDAVLVLYTTTGALDITWGTLGFLDRPIATNKNSVVVLADVKPQGVNGGTFTAGAWQTRALNKIMGGSSNVVLGNNQIILQPGIYRLDIVCSAYKVGKHQIRLQDVTDGVTVSVGSSSYSDPSGAAVTNSLMGSRIIVNKITTFEVQHQCQTTELNDGFGLAAGFAPEVYSAVRITQE